MANQIADHLKQHRPELIKLIEQMVNLESPSSDKAACDKLISFMAEQCRLLTSQVERIPMAGFGDVLKATWGQADEQILIISHLDTVWPVGTAAERPFKVQGDRASGPGIFDMKTGAAQGLAAALALKALGRQPDKKVVFLFNCDEEVGTRESRAVIEAEAAKSKAVICLEPSSKGMAKIERKGVGMFTLTAYGRPSHAGADHKQGINANLELAHQIIRLESMTDYETGLTVNVGMISGGEARNQAAARAEAQVDFRFTTPDQGMEFEKTLQGLTPFIHGARIEFSGGINRPPFEPNPGNMALFHKARELAGEIGFELEGGKTGGGSDGSFTAALGIPTLDGMGAVGAGGHAVDEYIELEHLVPRTTLIARLLETI